MKTNLTLILTALIASPAAMAYSPGIPPQADAGAVISWEIHNDQQRRIEENLIYGGDGYYGAPVYGGGHRGRAGYYGPPAVGYAPSHSVMCTVRNSWGQTFVASGLNAQVVGQNLISYCMTSDHSQACASTIKCH